ncbi:abnormal spindle-like microcephaly-associated protein isoform X2 [Myotis myotis]|uniref:abnormal spindle-like microcephaly-associated protein isoform X2 n=1 Tax=Myotis myotis TaxID=51298 RepID=UPI001749ACD3|nr:abnormal spindle-like microcephaly-associated protein isoform X2 [Myotis myotis]
MAARRGCGGAGASGRGPPPVLILSHFCPRPFVCFGDLRPGASRTLPLAVLNPNAEAAAVTVPRGPAADRGFRVCPRAFELQPKEKIVISVNWTPVKEGRVREILTFLVNDILKHEVILLGNAEEPRKKKRSLWDTIKKKKVSSSSSHKKRISNIQNVNQTFSVPPKADRVRSPLQACENLGGNEGCSPTENNSLILQENKIPISPISPTFKECHGDTCLPLCVRRSTTYTSLHSPESGELWTLEGAHMRKEFNGKVITETSFDSLTGINGQIEEDGKRSLTPNCSSTWNITQSQGDFLSPDSFVKNSRRASNKLEPVTVSPDTFLKDDSRPRHLESNTIHEIYRTILSPDSFLKDNYGLNQKLESESVNPFVSPNQFVRDNMPYLSLSQPTCELSPLSKERSQAPPSPPGQRKNEVLPFIPGNQGANSPKAIFAEPEASEMIPDGHSFTKQKQPAFPAAQDTAGQAHGAQPRRRPILSATVTKPKPAGPRERGTEPSEPKARRCLRSAVGDCRNAADDQEEEEDALHPYLPVIDPAGGNPEGCRRAAPSCKAAFQARKRKSGGGGEDAAGASAGAGHAGERESKRIHFSPAESRASTAKKTNAPGTPASQCRSSRGRPHPKKKADSLAFKTPNSKTHKRTPRMVPVAQASLTFIKRLKTDIPRHPMPFAAKNIFYDERWKEKQQQGLTWWLNFILTPDDFAVKTHVSEVNAASLLLGGESHHKLSVPRAPTKEEASLRAYTARRRLNHLRHAACRLFTSESMVKAIRKLEGEIAARRLAVRRDRHLWKDVGERQKVLNWLLSYNPLWLRIGLETVFGELIALEDNSDVTGLAVFILSRLLWNPDIAAEYQHPSVPHLYRDGHEEALSAFTLKKLLLLVCFLDRAKLSRLIDHDPCLFCKDAEFKASRDVLLAFSRGFLSGEGDLSRHLSWLGLPVSHVQTPLDEFDFAVTNLAVDLQCGVRLVRTMELLTRNWDLSKQLRIPAISRLQKMHNVDLALQALRARGIPLQDEQGGAILAKDIVDRHREKTLALLWKIALAFQVDISLNLDELKEEIGFLKRTWRVKRSTPARSRPADAVPSEKTDPRPSGSSEQRPESIRLLMEWVQAVCAFYSLKVENFTVSFSDGRVLCYLIHHYHPRCVPLDAIRQRTSQTVECAQSGSVVLNSSSESDESCLDLSLKAVELGTAPELHRELLENERRNFQLVSSAARDLGGIPAMVQHADMSNTIPDEKVVITYLSFLCARLLDLRRETRAARRIQAAWRDHKLRADLRRHQERDRAARTIQAAVLGFLTRRRLRKDAQAALVIQRRWRGLCRRRAVLRAAQEQLEEAQSQSASVIQRNWRRYSARKRFLRLRHYSVVLQSRRRMVAAVASYRRHLWAAVTIQRHWRACVRRKQDQQSYRALRASCLVIQSAFRRWRCREQRLRMRAAATLQRAFRGWRARKRAREDKAATALQAWYRAHREVRRFRHVRACVVLIQARFRGFRARKLFQRKKASVLTIQQRWRAHLQGKAERGRFLQARAAALRLQAAFRAARARDRRRQTRAACVLQAYWRMRRERAQFLSFRQTVIRLQALVRKHQQLQKYRKMKSAALVIQVHFRAYMAARRARVSYQETRAAVLVLQSACRGMWARRRFRLARTSVVKIQSHCRACIARRRFLSLKHAAVRLQSIVRMRQTCARYLRLRAAALFTQRRYRALKTAARRREEYRRVRAACIRLQALARGHLVRRQLRLQSSAALTLQSCFRMREARRHFLRVRRAALVIQRAYRARQARLRRRKHQQVLRAVTRLQAAYRGYRARQLLRRRATAARKIQAAFRGHRERARFRSVLRSAVMIQRWYRARRTARDLRAQFFRARTAALSLQAACRGWKVRAQIRREQQAALTIQAAFRAAQAQRQFRRLRTAALALQRHWRARAAGRRQRLVYAGLRQAALTLQAAWRGRTARRQIQKRHECATVIQARYRMHAQRRRWAALREAARLIQARYRAHRLGRRQRLWYLKTKAAVVTLQSAFRRMRARRESARERGRAAAVIQSRYRAHRARRRYAAYRASAIAIQRWYRHVRAAHQQRREYLHLKEAATHLQAAYRGLRARRQLQRMHTAATAIQAVFKMHQAQGRFRQVRAAAVVIQVRYRARRQGRTQRARYLAVLQAARVLQASWRGARVRRTLRQMQSAAVLIQSCYRRYRQQTHFLQLKWATEAVQRRYRAAQAGRLQLQSYASLRRCAIRVQAAFRGRRARRRVRALHLAAAVIQRWFRALLARRRFLSLRSTAIWAQRRYRANVHAKHRRQLLRLREAAVKIQARVRGWLVRRRLREMHRAATVVQAALRMHRARARYQALKQASVLLQRRYRACRAARLRREECVGQRGAAEVLPAAPEGAKAGQLSREQHRAAAIIQSAYRRHRRRLSHQQLRAAPRVTRDRHSANEKEAPGHRALPKAAACTPAGSAAPAVGERSREQRPAAVTVQPHLRPVRRRKRFLQFRAAAGFVQRRRSVAAAARTPAAPGPQSSCRGSRGHGDGDGRLRATTRIQASQRTHRARAADRAEGRAAAVVQSPCGPYVRGTAGARRCSAARRPAPPAEAACRGPRGRWALGGASEGAVAASAGPPASHCDGPGAQQDAAWSPAARPHSGAEAHSQREAAVTSPPALRETAPGMLGAREPAALRVRPSLRMAACHSRFVRRSRAVVTLPLSCRARRARGRFLLGRDAVAVQSRRRACASARLRRRACLRIRGSVVIIQAWTRGFLQKRKFRRIKASALIIQAAWRSYRARRRAHAVEAACRIQAWFRGWQARKRYLAVLKAVRAVQGRFRARRARAWFLSVRASAVTIQRRWRATLGGRRAREHFLAVQTSESRATVRLLHFAAAARCHLAAVRIQRAYRRHAAVRSAERHLDSVICIQRWFRARLRLRRFVQVCHSIIGLQHEVEERRRRQHRAASVIQAATRRFLLRRKQARLRHSIVKIQALWRGYALRKKNNCTKIKAIRRSLQALSGEVREEDKLYKRTSLALFHLLTYKHLSAVLEALKHLEVVTRLSPLCCENMAQSGAIRKIFLLIRSCNRSVPCMEVVSYAVQVLLHVAKYEKTTAAVGAVDGCVDTLLDLLRMYREKPGDKIADKSGSIFTKTCCLLAVLLKATGRASDVQSRSKVADCVSSIYRLTAHKHRVDAERILHKQSQNSGSLPRLPETAPRARMVARLQPGWVLRRDNVQEITAPLQAVQLVMDTLGVPYP